MGNEICCSNSGKPEQEEIKSSKPQKNIISKEKSIDNNCPISLKVNFDKNHLIKHDNETEDINDNIDIILNDQNVYDLNDNNSPQNNNEIKYSYKNNNFQNSIQNINNGNIYEKKDSFKDIFISRNPFEDRDTLSTKNNFQFHNSLNLKNHFFNNSNNNLFSNVSTIKTNKLSENEKFRAQSLTNNNIYNSNNILNIKKQNENNMIHFSINNNDNKIDDFNQIIGKETVSLIKPNDFNINQISFNGSTNNNIFSNNNYIVGDNINENIISNNIGYSNINNNNINQNNNYIDDININNNIIKNETTNIPQNQYFIQNDNNIQNNDLIQDKYINQNTYKNDNINNNINFDNKNTSVYSTNDINLIQNININQENDIITNGNTDYNLMSNNLNSPRNEIIQNKTNIQNNNIYPYNNNYIIQNNDNDNNNKTQDSSNHTEKNEKSKSKENDEEDEDDISFSKKEIDFIFNEGGKKLEYLKKGEKSPEIKTLKDLLDTEYRKAYKSQIPDSEENSSQAEKTEFSKRTISVREIQPLKNETIEEKPEFGKEHFNQEKIITKQNKGIEKTIVKKPIVYTTISPKKYIKTLSPEKRQVVESKPKYSKIIESPTKVEYNIKNIDVMSKDDLNKLINNSVNNNISNNNEINNIDKINTIDNNINIDDNKGIENDNDNYSLYSFKDNINDKNIHSSLKNIQEKKIIIESKQNNDYNPMKDNINKITNENIRYQSQIKSNNIIPNLDLSIKTSTSYIHYDNLNKNNENNLYSENIEMSPVTETRHIKENPISIKKSITQYNNNINNLNIFDNSSTIEYNQSNIYPLSMTYGKPNYYRQPTLFQQYNQSRPFQKTNKLNLNNEYDLNNIKKAKSLDINTNIPNINNSFNMYGEINNINNTFNNNHQYKNEDINGISSIKPESSSILNVDYLNSIKNSDLSSKSSFVQRTYSLGSHRSIISNSPNNQNNDMNNSPYLNQRSMSQKEFSEPFLRSNRFNENKSQVFSHRYESPIGDNKNIINNSINNNNILNNSLYQQNQIANNHPININNIAIEEENRQIINYYLNMNCNNISTFSPNSFKLFYPQFEDHFKIPENEIYAQKELTNYINNNPNLQEKYIGSVNQYNQMHGFGRLISPNSQKIGTWRNGQFSGWGREISNNGEVYEGKFKNGKISGKGIYKYKDNLYIGDFDNNIRQGKGEKITKNYYYKGEFNRDKIDGYGKIQFINSNDGKIEYEGFFKENNIEGKGIMKWNNGNVYEGYVKNGKMNGYGRFIPKNGVDIKGLFKDGIRIEATEINNSQIYNNNKKYYY